MKGCKAQDRANPDTGFGLIAVRHFLVIALQLNAKILVQEMGKANLPTFSKGPRARALRCPHKIGGQFVRRRAD